MPTQSHPTITLGAGCFWCSEAVFVQVRGVLDVESGYSNGHVQEPRYEDVCSGASGHNEVIKLVYDTAQISLREILEIMFLIHDPTSLNRQGNDVGPQYRSGIYCADAQQLAEVRAFVDEVQASGAFSRPIVTELALLDNYWPAEAYHQDFFARNPNQGYCMAVAAPKVDKFRKTFARLAKA
jgi:peptide-methionine (S)-S-oxide reductase